MLHGPFGVGFTRLSIRERDALIDAVRQDGDAFPNPRAVGELYGEVCGFLDAHEEYPIAGDPEFVRRSRNRAFGILATVRGYLRMLSILEEENSLAFCNQFWDDSGLGDARMEPVFEAVALGEISSDRMATLLFNGGVQVQEELRPRHFATVFGRLPLLNNRPSIQGGEYQNDLPRDLAAAVNRTQLVELAEHLLTERQLNPDIFGDRNVLRELPGDTLGTVDRACAAWQALNPDVADPAFHLVISNIETWGNYHGVFPAGNPMAGIGQHSVHWCPEVADRFDGPGSVWFLVAEPRDRRAAFDLTRFTDVNDGFHHTPTLGVRPTGDGLFDIGLDLRLRIDVREPSWILAVVVA